MHKVLILLVCAGAATSTATAANLFVTTTADTFDSGGTCSLREAVQAANNNADGRGCVGQGTYGDDTIVLGSGNFVLGRLGFDDTNVLGDLDVLDDLTIDGVAAGNTNIAGDTSANDADRDRVLHVVSGGIQVTLRELTIRDGRTTGTTAGGGLRTEPGSTTTLDRVVVGLNSSGGSAGGILNRGTMSILDSAVTGNTVRGAPVDGGGGGIFNSGTLILTRVRVLGNTVNADLEGRAGGGGVRSAATAAVTVRESSFEDNQVITSGGRTDAYGGGMFISGAFDIEGSTLHANTLDCEPGTIVTELSTCAGGGLATELGGELRRVLLLDNAVLEAEFGRGGGWSAECGNACVLRLVDSVVDGNLIDSDGASAGGVNWSTGESGAFLITGQISGTAIVGNAITSNDEFNRGVSGGGISLTVLSAQIVNSTVHGNQSDGDAGGVQLARGTIELFNTTVTGNLSNANGQSGGDGGGLVVFSTANASLRNVVIAGNDAGGNAVDDDCRGALGNSSDTWIGAVQSCTFAGAHDRILVGADPLLAAPADNGGPLAGAANATVAPRRALSRLPVAASPLIDAGDPSGCRAPGGSLLTVDQRGALRPTDGPDPDAVARCDIGAVETADEAAVTLLTDGFEDTSIAPLHGR